MRKPSTATTGSSRSRRSAWPPTAGSTNSARARKPARAWLATPCVENASGGPPSAVRGRRAILGALELEHDPAKQAVQLFLLRLGQRRCEELLLASLDVDRALVDALPLVRQLDQDPTAVIGVRQAAKEAGRLEPVETIRHRTARELHQLGEFARRAAKAFPFSRQQAEQLPLRVVEIDLGERLVQRSLE